MKILELHKWYHENHEKLKIPQKNHKNCENHNILLENHEKS